MNFLNEGKMSKKLDELDTYLSRKYPNNYITGDDRCSLLIWGAPTNNGVVPKLCTLTVGADFETQNATDRKSTRLNSSHSV